MRCAYADPPYPGQAKRHYGKDGDPFEGDVAEVDHAALIKGLERDFPDGWALSTSALALQDVLATCPQRQRGTKYFSLDHGVRVAVWHKTNSAPTPPSRWWLSWEPVIVRGGRWRQSEPADFARDVLATPNLSGWMGDTTIIGQKPPAFCRWMFDLLGLTSDDELVDMFPGSGAVGHAWESWRRQLRLAV